MYKKRQNAKELGLENRQNTKELGLENRQNAKELGQSTGISDVPL
jgi:hypothetical protein